MSYHRALGLLDPSPTQLFAQAVDPYGFRAHPDAVYSPYGWGPDFTYGMPFNYTHHIDYVRTPIPGARRIGPMYDRLSGVSRDPMAGKPAPIHQAIDHLRAQLRGQRNVLMIMPAFDEQGPYVVVVGDRRRGSDPVVPRWIDGFRVTVSMTTPIVPLEPSREAMLSGVLAVL